MLTKHHPFLNNNILVEFNNLVLSSLSSLSASSDLRGSFNKTNATSDSADSTNIISEGVRDSALLILLILSFLEVPVILPRLILFLKLVKYHIKKIILSKFLLQYSLLLPKTIKYILKVMEIIIKLVY